MKQNKFTIAALLIALLFPIVLSAAVSFAVEDDIPSTGEELPVITEPEESSTEEEITTAENEKETTTPEPGENTTPEESGTIDPKTEETSAPEKEETTFPEPETTTTPEVTTTTKPVTTAPPAVTTTVTTTTPGTTASTTTRREPGPQQDPIKDGEVSITPPPLSPSVPMTGTVGTTAKEGGMISPEITLATSSVTTHPKVTSEDEKLISGRFAAACLAVFGSVTVVSVLFFVFSKKG